MAPLHWVTFAASLVMYGCASGSFSQNALCFSSLVGLALPCAVVPVCLTQATTSLCLETGVVRKAQCSATNGISLFLVGPRLSWVGPSLCEGVFLLVGTAFLEAVVEMRTFVESGKSSPVSGGGDADF